MVLEMESGYETIELDVRNYISPECSCKIEDIVNAVEHVVDASFDPVNNLLKVRVHRGMISAKDITRELGRCRVSCEERKSVHEMAHMEHEAMKMKKPAADDHHAMMEVVNEKAFHRGGDFHDSGSDPLTVDSDVASLYPASIFLLESSSCSLRFCCDLVWRLCLLQGLD